MEHMKEIVEAISMRIRSHFFSSIVLSFIGFNWQPIFYLFVSKEAVDDRLLNVAADLVYIWPILVGIGFAFVAPWVAWFGNWVARKPIELVKIREVRTENTVENKRIELLADGAEERARLAKANADTAKSEEDEANAKARTKSSEENNNYIPSSTKAGTVADIAKGFTEPEKELLIEMYEDQDGMLNTIKTGGKEVIRLGDFEFGSENYPPHMYSRGLENLEENQYIENMPEQGFRSSNYKLTISGSEMAHHLIGLSKPDPKDNGEAQ